MKRIILTLLLIIRFVASYSSTTLHVEDATYSNSPNKLISSYCEMDVHPFGKGAGVAKLFISFGDKDLRIEDRELVIDQNPVFLVI